MRSWICNMAEIRVIHEKDIEEKGNEETKFRDLFNSDNPSISIAKISRQTNDKTLGYDEVSDNFYYVLEGQGICVTDNQEVKLKRGDLIVIPKKTKYKNVGSLKLLAISVPKFNKLNQVYDKK